MGNLIFVSHLVSAAEIDNSVDESWYLSIDLLLFYLWVSENYCSENWVRQEARVILIPNLL